MKVIAKFCAGWMFLVALSLFLPTAASTVQEADSAQFLALGSECLRSGWPLAHPPGYPLHTAFSCASAWVAKTTPIPAALMLSWISALFAAIAAAVAFHFTGGTTGAIAVATVFLARDVWRTATLQEPFGLAMLTFIVGMMAVARGKGRMAWLVTGLAFGVALANHHTTAIALPAVLWLLLKQNKCRNAAFFAGGAAAGALPTLLVFAAALAAKPFPITAPGQPGLAFDWSRFLLDGSESAEVSWFTAGVHALRYLLRIDFGTFAMATHPASASMPMIPPAFKFFITSLPENIGWAGIALAVTGFVVMIRKARTNLHWFLTLATAAVFVLLIRLPVNDNLIDVIRRQFAIPLLSLLPFIHSGLQTLATRRAAVAAAAVLAIVNIAFHLPDVRLDQRNFPEWHFKSSLSGLPSGSLVIAASDEHVFGLSYVQATLGIRPDTRILNLLEWATPRERSLSLARTGIVPTAELLSLNRGQLVMALAKNEPVWIIDPPQKPWPEYLASAVCGGPFLVLDLRKESSLKAAEWKPTAAQNPPSGMQLPWDRTMLQQYADCGAGK